MDAKKTTLCKHRARTSNSPNQSLPHPLGLKGLLLSDLLLTLKDKKSRMWQLRVPQTSSAAALGRNRPLSTVHRSACVNDRIRCRSSKLGDAPTIALRDEPVPLSADGVYAVYDESKTLQVIWKDGVLVSQHAVCKGLVCRQFLGWDARKHLMLLPCYPSHH